MELLVITTLFYNRPEDRAEMGRKLAIIMGLLPVSVSEIGKFIVRKAAIEKPVKAHVILSNEERIEQGRKLAIAAGIL